MSDGDHGSNVDLDNAHDLVLEMRRLKDAQDAQMARLEGLRDSIPDLRLAWLEKRNEAITTAKNPNGIKEQKDFHARQQARHLEMAELDFEVAKRWLATLESQVSAMQSRLTTLKAQIHMDGRAR